jgi:hypothetical protein
MPWAAAMTSSMLIGVKSATQQPTGEWVAAWSYSGAIGVPCRIYDGDARSVAAQWGQELQVDLVALVSAGTAPSPARIGGDAGERQQVQIDGIAYQVLDVRDLAHMGKLKAVALRIIK